MKAAPQSAAPKRNDMKLSWLDFLVPANSAAVTAGRALFEGDNWENLCCAELKHFAARHEMLAPFPKPPTCQGQPAAVTGRGLRVLRGSDRRAFVAIVVDVFAHERHLAVPFARPKFDADRFDAARAKRYERIEADRRAIEPVLQAA